VLIGGALTANAATTTTTRPARTLYSGRAFDTCTAPSLTTMKAWKSSGFYGAGAVYVGGKNRGCSQPNLTSSWVKSVSATGMKLIPLYVGAQPPCASGSNPEIISSSTTTAATQGKTDGADAVAKASALGMTTGSAVYLDMEGFDSTNTSCKNAVLSYVHAWNDAVKAKLYYAGFYGFKSSSAAVVVNDTNRSHLPDAIWYALWDQVNTTTSDWPWKSTWWTGHQRGHQYLVNSKETHNGYTLTVDRSGWDAPVAKVG
jgi:Domain of unknown function (DUF1906)